MSATEIYLMICFLAAAGGFLYMAGFALWSNKDWSGATTTGLNLHLSTQNSGLSYAAG